MSLSIADTIFLCGSLIGFGGAFIYLGIALYIAYTKMDMMLTCFKNSPYIMIRAPILNGGPWGRLFVLREIVGVLQVPGLYIPDGDVCPADIDQFPKQLKARLIMLQRVGGYFAWELILLCIFFRIDWASMKPLRLGIALLAMAAIPVWIGLCLRVASTQTNFIVMHFKNSSAIKARTKLNSGGRFAKLVFIVALSVIVACSVLFVRRGTLDAAELETLPRQLKVKLSALFVLMVVIVVSFILLYVFRP